MDWETYEEVVKNIYEALGKSVGVTIECFGSTCKIKGKSDVEHQIDVLSHHSDGIHSYRTAIECKYWNEKINKDIVMKVADIVEDSKLNKGVIVSKLGFTADAIKTAKNRNIGLVELREPTEEDWKGRIKTIIVNITMLVPQITKMDFLINETTTPPPNTQISSLLLPEYNVKEPDGAIHIIEEIAKEFTTELAKQEEGKEYSKIYPFKDGAILADSSTNLNLKVIGVKFTGILRITKPKKIEINGQDRVWLIMKSYFENKRYTISKDSDITEHE